VNQGEKKIRLRAKFYDGGKIMSRMMKRGSWWLTICLLVGITVAAACSAYAQSAGEPYKAMDFSRLKGLEGFSDTLLSNHFTLYQGYVKNTNLLLADLNAMLSDGKDGTPEYAELKRRLGWEFNGMRLHELYFGNLGTSRPPDEKTPLFKKMVKDFGSFDNWKKDFMATGKMRGIGWVVLYYDPAGNRLMNMWIEQHDANHPAGCAPLLVMDVFEHAYMPDYGLNKPGYIDTFVRKINWDAVTARFK
jgi:superoxide dismutase, Fe-Mn family